MKIDTSVKIDTSDQVVTGGVYEVSWTEDGKPSQTFGVTNWKTRRFKSATEAIVFALSMADEYGFVDSNGDDIVKVFHLVDDNTVGEFILGKGSASYLALDG